MERVCLIQGTLDGITRMHNYIMDRMLEKPECLGPLGTGQLKITGSGLNPNVTESSGISSTTAVATASGVGQMELHPGPSWSTVSGNRLPWERHQQVKILVPNCTAGLVIGKLGSYVKEIKDRTGAFIQISQKSKEINLPERCITIAGEPYQCRAAVALVLAKIAEDPQSTSCPTISYSGFQGPVASAYPTGSPFAFVSNPASTRFPTVTAAQSSGRQMTDISYPSAGSNYVPVPDPYMSPVFQAALLQAGLALALNQRGPYYHPQATAHPRFVACSTSQQPTGSTGPTTFTHAGLVQPQTNVEYHQTTSAPTGGSPLAAGAGGGAGGGGGGGGGDLNMYAMLNQPGAAHFFNPSGAHAGLWAGCEGGWSGVTDAHANPASFGTVQPGGPTVPPSAAAYEQTYPTALNFAYYPATQSILTPIASRHPSETYRPSTDLYSASPYTPGLSIPFHTPPGLNATSPTGVTPLASIYPGLYSHLAQVGTEFAPMPPPPTAKVTTLTAQQSAMPLSELLGSLQLGGHSYTELSGQDASSLFSTLTPHHAGFFSVSNYPTGTVLPSPTGRGSSVLSGIPFIEPIVQSTGPPPAHLGVVPVDFPPGSVCLMGDPRSVVSTSADRPSTSSGGSTLTDLSSSVHVRRRPDHALEPPVISDTDLKDSQPSSAFVTRLSSCYDSPPATSISPIATLLDPVSASSPTSDSHLDDSDQTTSFGSPSDRTNHSHCSEPIPTDASSSHTHFPVVNTEAGNYDPSLSVTSAGIREGHVKTGKPGPRKPIANGQTTTTTQPAANGVQK
ncbi:hypothetical protein P879_03007 [Paragonimus westermani]|uniref:K Homology domain-containing protein n=1 Tax=Paragonimus westermani TaxID=34504 RepID=A0A8T0D4N0_9TREM|nr:hypothetical protein P879_03007 [Paragonimus westermani]